ncbi:MAG: tetratricopeptide repeat protein [Deltaproteobacteria bacterium]|nr:tetratricopeptide repeat protein [Deltaproteobacteria bacterium]
MPNENTLFTEAEQYGKQGKFDLALERYDKAIALGIGNQALAHQGKGRALVGLGHFDEAIEELLLALKLNPKSSLTLRALGYACRAQEMYDLAEESFLAAIKDSDEILSIGHLAELYDDLNRYPEAIMHLKKYLAHQPDDIYRRLNLARIYMVQADLSQSINQLNIVFRTKPTEWRLYFFYGLFLLAIIAHFKPLYGLVIFGLVIGVNAIALFAPVSLSVPFGMGLSILVLPLTYLLLLGIKNKVRGPFAIIFSPIVICGFYWVLVWLHYHFSKL